MNALRDAVLSLAELDAVMPPEDQAGFVARVRAACHEARLALPPRFGRVRVLPLAQAAGLEADVVLLAGMDETAVPGAAAPHPLIPPPLARRCGMPACDGARVRETAVWLWEQVRAMAPVVECSCARQRDGVALGPSPLVAGLPVGEPLALEARASAPAPDMFEDAPPVPLGDDERASGGAALLRDQSACPFRAFVRRRLGVESWREAAPGMAASDRGSLVHRALDHFWQGVESQSRLRAMSGEEQAKAVDDAVRAAWEAAAPPLDATLARVEQTRMRRLLRAWIRLEAERPPFRVVEREAKHALSLPASGADAGRMALSLRVDRVDEDAGGRRIVLDYKTGRKQSARGWAGERPAEPQLPLYALALQPEAVAFAHVRSGEMGFDGLGAADTGIKGVRACNADDGGDWQARMREWRWAMDALAREFIEGRCEVAPRDADACRHCGLEAVCRIGERGA